MAKQLNVKLNFAADTSQAKSAISELQSSLTKVATGQVGIGINPAQLEKASSAAKELSIHLNNAYNADLGNLDLNKFYKGSAVPTVDHDAINDLIFGLPPIAEQNRIVATITELFSILDKISLNLV